MIKSFRDNRTQKIFSGKKIKEYQGFYDQAVRRLQILDAAVTPTLQKSRMLQIQGVQGCSCSALLQTLGNEGYAV